MLGMGGSQLYIPLLFFLGSDFKEVAIPLGLFLNFLTTSCAFVNYARGKLVDWKVFLAFSIPMAIMAPLGALCNVQLNTTYVIIAFGIFTIIAALFSLSGYKPSKSLEGWKQVIVIVLIATTLGFMAGLIGRGGGSFIVPILYAVGLDPKKASATSSGIVTFSALSALISHIELHAKITVLWLYCGLAVLIGATLGSRFMMKKLTGKTLRKLFGYVLLTIGTIMLYMGLKRLRQM